MNLCKKEIFGVDELRKGIEALPAEAYKSLVHACHISARNYVGLLSGGLPACGPSACMRRGPAGAWCMHATSLPGNMGAQRRAACVWHPCMHALSGTMAAQWRAACM